MVSVLREKTFVCVCVWGGSFPEMILNLGDTYKVKTIYEKFFAASQDLTGMQCAIIRYIIFQRN